MNETKLDDESVDFPNLLPDVLFLPFLIFSILSMVLFPIMVYCAEKFGVNVAYGIIAAIFLYIVVVASAIRKTKRYFSTTDLNEIQTHFNHFYYIWMPVISGAISIFFYFDSVVDAFFFYILTGVYFLFIASYFIFLEENQKDYKGIQDYILKIFMLLQFMIQTWFAFLLIHFWQKQKWVFLELLLVFGVGMLIFWLKPGKLILNHTLALRLFLYAFGLLVVWISWADFDLAHQIFSTDSNNIFMKLMVDSIVFLIYMVALSPKILQEIIIEYYNK